MPGPFGGRPVGRPVGKTPVLVGKIVPDGRGEATPVKLNMGGTFTVSLP